MFEDGAVPKTNEINVGDKELDTVAGRRRRRRVRVAGGDDLEGSFYVIEKEFQSLWVDEVTEADYLSFFSELRRSSVQFFSHVQFEITRCCLGGKNTKEQILPLNYCFGSEFVTFVNIANVEGEVQKNGEIVQHELFDV